MPYNIAAVDVHKKVLMVVISDAGSEDQHFLQRRFTASASDRQHVLAWLQQHGVQEVVMESTAQYWKPLWLDLEPHMQRLHLAQAYSNRAPKGRKHDFGDAERLLRRLICGELILSFVPDAEQRNWRMLMRGKLQLVRERVRLSNHLEALLEQMRIKLSSVISALLGLSGRRILEALAQGQSDPEALAELGDRRLQCSKEELAEALRGPVEPLQRRMLQWSLERLKLLDQQIQQMDQCAAEQMRSYAEAVMRLAEVPGFSADSAQQFIAEVGPRTQAFASAAQLASWIGVCPGRQESAEQNHSSRSPKGNVYARRILSQAAQAAVKRKGSHFQLAFRRWLPRLGYQATIWAIAHKLCRLAWKILHDGAAYFEQGELPPSKDRTRRMIRELRRLGYSVTAPAV